MIIEANRSTTVTIDGKQFSYFGGTNYLGLAHRPELMQAASKCFDTYGFSCGASRLTSGENDLLLSLERDLADFAGAEDALVLPAGFMSNLAVVDALDNQIDVWMIDKLAHGSIKSAIARSRKPVIEYQLDENLDRNRSLRAQLDLPEGCTLGIFAEPIDPLLGRLYPIAQLVSAATGQDFFILDEAHSFGVLGDNGVGALEHYALSVERLVRTGTFSKALGTHGGFVLAAKSIIEAIKLNSSSYKVSTPLSPVLCAATRESLRLIQEDRVSTITKLKTNMSALNAELCRLGFLDFKKNCVPIYHLPNLPEVSQLRDSLPGQGICAPTVTSYFADFCEIGLRWTIQAGHTEKQLGSLIEAMKRAGIRGT